MKKILLAILPLFFISAAFTENAASLDSPVYLGGQDRGRY